MKKQYQEILFSPGSNIDSAVKELNRAKEKGILAFGNFNGKELYSDVDDLDSAYKKIVGKSKAEYDEILRKEADEYKKRKDDHKSMIPELTKQWIEKGNSILEEKYQETWAKIVSIRLGDLYEGMELGASLEIISALNSGCTLDAAKLIIDEQGHSGMSFSLVCSMVKSFCNRGNEFFDHVRS